jgi:uncharacterized phage-like protein YoqJ
MSNIKKSCAFAGHRVFYDAPDENLLKKCVINLVNQGVDTFYSGMAMGFDLFAANVVIDVKKDYPNVKLVACIPCLGQERYYSATDKQLYEKVLVNCDDVVVLSEHYYNGCMFVRDRYMVDNSEYLIVYMRQKVGGTIYTLNYARSTHKCVLVM